MSKKRTGQVSKGTLFLSKWTNLFRFVFVTQIAANTTTNPIESMISPTKRFASFRTISSSSTPSPPMSPAETYHLQLDRLSWAQSTSPATELLPNWYSTPLTPTKKESPTKPTSHTRTDWTLLWLSSHFLHYIGSRWIQTVRSPP